MNVFTIGFTKTSAESFFERLRSAHVRTVVDVRLHNVSQLSGFAKRDDLRYFAKTICNADYVHRLELAPTAPLLDAYRKERIDWPSYEKEFIRLMEERRVETRVGRELLDQGCLLCSEDDPSRCHRRLVAEYLRRHWQELAIVHL